MSAQTKETTPEDKVFETNDKSLEHLEQQLYDFSLARQAGSSQIRMIHGSYLGLALLSVGLLIYSSYPVLKRMAIHKRRRLLKTKIDQGDDPSLVSIKEEQEPTLARNSLPQTTMETGTSTRAVTPVAPPRERPATASVIQLPSQTLQPALELN